MVARLKTYLWELPEPVRFLLAGGVNTLFGYLMFTLGFFALSLPLQAVGGLITQHYYLIIQWAMWVLSVPFGAFTFKYYAFQSQGAYLPQALRSYSVYLPAQLLASILLVVFLRLIHATWPTLAAQRYPFDVTVLVAQACTLVFSTTVSYLGHKYWTFRT